MGLFCKFEKSINYAEYYRWYKYKRCNVLDNRGEFESFNIDIGSKFSKAKFIVLMVINIAVIIYINIPLVQNNIWGFLVGAILWLAVVVIQIKNCKAYIKPETELREYRKIKWYIVTIIAVKVILVMAIILFSLPSYIVKYSGMSIEFEEAKLICCFIDSLPIGIIALIKMISSDQCAVIYNKYLFGAVTVNTALLFHDTLIYLMCYIIFFVFLYAMIYIVCDWFKIKFEEVLGLFDKL